MKKTQFVPPDFILPVLETKHFRLRMLSVDDVEKDYEAVILDFEQVKIASRYEIG